MGFAQWMRVLDTVGGLVQLTGRLRGSSDIAPPTPAGGGALGQLEARLAGVLVAALKEAFDRDSARLELERAQIDAERARAESALRAELRRQAAERALAQLRLIAVMAIGTWALSAALGSWLPGMSGPVPRVLLGIGWALALATLGAAFSGWQRISAWSADTHDADGARASSSAAAAAPWLFLAALAFTGLSVLTAI
ncbi:MAG TPA: hypothetical protein VD833_07105 [Vicinamibacterales bacterium]|nr:hypothetical protein [Vicinamibacterales bacterium]